MCVTVLFSLPDHIWQKPLTMFGPAVIIGTKTSYDTGNVISHVLGRFRTMS